MFPSRSTVFGVISCLTLGYLALGLSWTFENRLTWGAGDQLLHTGHEIVVIDELNELPVPLVTLVSVSGLKWVTDNAGVVVIDSPELLNRDVWFSISSHGYERKADGFGMRGVRISTRRGQRTEVRIHRTMRAERIGRTTGSGLVAESQKIGRFLEHAETEVVGCDTAFVTPWKGKLFWLWGDTNVVQYPLGIFNTLGATSEFCEDSLQANAPSNSLGVLNSNEWSSPLLPVWNYFRDDQGKLRGIADMDHKGPVWLGGLVALPDQKGVEHLVATYAKIENRLDTVEVGLCEWDEGREVFKPVRTLWARKDSTDRKPASLLIPDGQPVRFVTSEGIEQLLFVNPFPQVQMLYSYEAWSNPSSWVQPVSHKANGWEDGEWTDQKAAVPKKVKAHRGDMVWSARIGKWVMVFTEIGGKSSFLGEVWCTVSDSPLGPWQPPIPIVTHNNYSFYNPIIHDYASNTMATNQESVSRESIEPALLDQESAFIYFEGTYTAEFAEHAEKTPRFDYNQVMYRLNLDELPKPLSR